MKINFTAAALVIAVALTGCKPDHEHEHAHDHGHSHNEVLQLRASGNDFEVSVKATPFVMGQAGDVSASFSNLRDNKPLAEGSVTASLTIGTDATSQTLEQPTSPGVYTFSLLPATAGKGSLTFEIKTPGGASQVVVTDITVYTNEHDAHHAAAQLAAAENDAAKETK